MEEQSLGDEEYEEQQKNAKKKGEQKKMRMCEYNRMTRMKASE